MPPRATHPSRASSGAQERDARRRYQDAIANALESLRRAELRFEASAAAIDAHIQAALAAADSLTSSLVAVVRLERLTGDAASSAPASPEEALA